MTESAHHDEADSFDNNVSRRRAMQLGAAGVAAVAAGGALTGTVGAQQVDHTSDLAHDPRIDGTVTVAEHGPEMSQMQYIDDQGEVAWLIDDGIVLAAGEDDTPHNPVTIQANAIAAEDYRNFPRGEQYDSDSDGEDDADLDVVDATHWSVDDSSSAGSGTVETVTGPNDEDALHVSTSSNDATITFSFSDFTIDSGELRKVMQLIADVDSLDSAATVEVSAVDSNDAKATATIDSSADGSADDVIATATGTSIVYQQQLGTLVGSLDTIQSLEVAVSGANADVTFSALNLAREDAWSFGTYERTNSDDEVETATYTEPSGTFAITGLDSLGGAVAGSRIHGVQYDVEQRARELPSNQTLIRETEVDTTQYDRPVRLEVAHVFEWPTAYDIDSSVGTLRDVVRMASSRYLTVGVETAAGNVETWDDVDDLDMAAKTSQYDSVDAERDLSSAISPGDTVVVYYDLSLDEGEADAYLSSGGGGAAGGSSDGGDDGVIGMLLGGGVLGLVAFVVNKIRKGLSAASS